MHELIGSRIHRGLPVLSRTFLCILFAALLACLSGWELAAEESGHPFLKDLRTANADGLMVLLPPFNPLAKEQTKAVHSSKAVEKVIPGAKVLLLDPESNAPEERALIKQYSLGDSATTLAVDASGKPYAADLGLASEADALEKFLSGALKAKQKRDEAFAAAATAEGEAAARSLDTGLSSVPEVYWMPFYSNEIDKLIKGAPADIREKYQTFLKRYSRQSDVKSLMAAVLENIDPKQSNVDEILKRFDHELAARNLPPESRQLAEMHRFRYLAQAQRYEDALKTLDTAERLAPESPLAKNIPRFRDRIKAAMQKAKPENPPDEKAPPGDQPKEAEPKP